MHILYAEENHVGTTGRNQGKFILTKDKNVFGQELHFISLPYTKENSNYDVQLSGEAEVLYKHRNALTVRAYGECSITYDAGMGYTQGNGRYLELSLNGTKLALGKSVTIDLDEYQKDFAVKTVVCRDAFGNLCVGYSDYLLAVIEIPPRKYDIELGQYDDCGFVRMYKKPVTVNTDDITVTLWKEAFI